jgi:hypothetical protein
MLFAVVGSAQKESQVLGWLILGSPSLRRFSFIGKVTATLRIKKLSMVKNKERRIGN